VSGSIGDDLAEVVVIGFFSPDQKWVYYWDPYDGANVLRVQLDGSGRPEAVPGSSSISSPALAGPGVVSRDGKTLGRFAQVLNPASSKPDQRLVSTRQGPRHRGVCVPALEPRGEGEGSRTKQPGLQTGPGKFGRPAL
jgi:hypothetical protein